MFVLHSDLSGFRLLFCRYLGLFSTEHSHPQILPSLFMLGISFIIIRNRSGEKRDPCGEPFSKVYLDQKEFSTLTWIFLLERNPSIQLYILP